MELPLFNPGRKNYNNCQNKKLGTITSRREQNVQKFPYKDFRIFEFVKMTLECPRGSLSSMEFKRDSLKANQELAKLAAASICRACPFAKLSPIEVQISLANEQRARHETVIAFKTAEEATIETEKKFDLKPGTLRQLGTPPTNEN